MLTSLTGYRTYILGALGLITIGLYVLGFIDATIAQALLGVFGFGSLITLRAAVSNAQGN